ncbi:MAG: hypothetical protein ILP02_02395, partial [Clostridia bacterium]|nr:hypothetical protein [Clostridia bacterium]
MSSKYNYTKEEIESKKRKMYADMDKSVAEQAREAEKVSYKTRLGLERKSTDDTTDEELLASIKAGLDQKYGDLAKKATEDAEKKRYSFSEM